MLLDSNVIIDAAKPGGEHLSAYLNHPAASVSIISRIESLGFSRLTAEEGTKITHSLKLLAELPLDEEIAVRAIGLRQQKKMNLGDAIIAATALEYGVPLVTRNVDDFKHIPGLQIINPFATLP
ncbi:MAG: type II toxin-antitoxin system VapC family toxin [Roseimicrobium sp.]